MCFVGACKQKPRSFLNHHQHKKHQQDHENVKCPECNEVFSAKRNMNRHSKRKHKAVESNTTENSNESNNDENLNVLNFKCTPGTISRKLVNIKFIDTFRVVRHVNEIEPFYFLPFLIYQS